MTFLKVLHQTIGVTLLLLFLFGCATTPSLVSQTATPAVIPSTAKLTPTPTFSVFKSTPWSTSVYPTPALTPATTFVDGRSEVPEGKALFIEAWYATEWPMECGEGISMHDGYYRFSEGRLVSRDVSPTSNRSRVLVGKGRSCWGARSKITPVDSLPYTIPDWEVVIHAVDAQGAAVMTIEGNTVWLDPGQGWESKKEERYSKDRVVVRTRRLTNYGLLDESQIDLGDFRPGMVVPRDLPTPTPEPESTLNCKLIYATGGYPTILGIEFAPDNTVWILTGGHGETVKRFSPTGDRLAPPDQLPIEHGIGAIAFVDHERYWVGNSAVVEGVYYFDGQAWIEFTVADGLISNRVYDIVIGQSGEVWFATGDGVSQYKPETNIWTNYTFFGDRPADNCFEQIVLAPDESIWLLQCYHPIVRLVPGPNGEKSYQSHIIVERNDDSAPIYNYVEAVMDSAGGLWAVGGDEVARFDTSQLTWTQYDNWTTGGAMPPVGIRSIDIAPDGSVWMGTYEHGAIQFVPGTSAADGTWIVRWDDMLSGRDLYHTAVDVNGNVWFGTKDGRIILCSRDEP